LISASFVIPELAAFPFSVGHLSVFFDAFVGQW